MPPADPRPLDYAQPFRERSPVSFRVLGLAVIVAVLVVIGFLLLPARGIGDVSCRGKCASNEHQIGLVILLYRQDYAQRYPPALADLLADEEIGYHVFTCPSSDDSPAFAPSSTTPAPTTQQAAAAFAAGGHCSYLYFGHADWTDRSVPADAIVLAEPPSNHGGDGANILYGDGHAEWVPMPRAARLIAAASATTRPVSAATVP